MRAAVILLRWLLPGWWRRWRRCLTPEPATSPTNQRKNNDNGRDNTGNDPIVHVPLPPCLLAASTITHNAEVVPSKACKVLTD
jgi:hypothetical protein